MKARVDIPFQNTIVRYLFAIAIVASTFALRIWLIPLTGTGAPFVLFFAAVLVTSLFAGVGPAICAVLLSMPLGAYTFVVGANYSIGQASFQSLLFAVDGIVVIYLTFLTKKGARSLQDANRQVRESKEKYRALFDSIDEGFCVVEVLFDEADNALDYRFLEVNRVFEKQTGISNAVGRRMREIAPAHEEHWFQIYGHIALTGESRRFENPALALGRFYDVYAFRLGRREQRQVAILFNDITEHKRAEEALRISEAKYSGIVSISADAIVSIDNDQRITIFNDGAEKIFGYSRSEAIGAPLEILIPDRFRRAHRQHVEVFAHGNVTARRAGNRLTAIAGLRKNGEEFPAEAAISKLQVGETILLTVALRDITERKRIEKEQQFLAEAGAVLGSTLDYEQTLITVAQLIVCDFADWCIVEVMEEHEHLRRLKVVSADPTKAALCSYLEHIPIDRDRPYLLRAVVETRQPVLIQHVSSEYLESVAQGPEHLQVLRAVSPRSLMALPLLVRGQLLGTLAFISSTPSRTYGPGDLRLAEALADRAAIAIENARLYRASLHATQLRDQVLGVVAHDLRNPLSTILMQASALKRQGPEPERRSQKPREGIHRAATRLNRLIQDLLDVAHMEAGQLTIKRARLSVCELVADAVDMQRALASSSSLELRVELQSDLPNVWGDRDRLLQVFENLIGNAIKFTKAGGSITVGAATSNQEVVFWVADTGCGIAPESLPRVFDRFWQGTRAEGQSGGLGLPITKGIVEAHGGRIWVKSTQGRGTTFSFTIPKASPGQDRRASP